MLAHNNLFDQMNALFEKYVKRGSVLEINISGEMRSFLNAFFGKPRSQLMELHGLVTMPGHFRQNTASEFNFDGGENINVNTNVNMNFERAPSADDNALTTNFSSSVNKPGRVILPMSPSDEHANNLNANEQFKQINDNNNNNIDGNNINMNPNTLEFNKINELNNNTDTDLNTPTIEDNIGRIVDNLSFAAANSTSLRNLGLDAMNNENNNETKENKQNKKAEKTVMQRNVSYELINNRSKSKSSGSDIHDAADSPSLDQNEALDIISGRKTFKDAENNNASNNNTNNTATTTNNNINNNNNNGVENETNKNDLNDNDLNKQHVTWRESTRLENYKLNTEHYASLRVASDTARTNLIDSFISIFEFVV